MNKFCLLSKVQVLIHNECFLGDLNSKWPNPFEKLYLLNLKCFWLMNKFCLLLKIQVLIHNECSLETQVVNGHILLKNYIYVLNARCL
jgi:hypothetical protein